MKILIILDPTYGTRNTSIEADAFWIVDSASNRALATASWNRRTFDPNSAIININRYTSRDDAALATFFNVLDHHPAWTEMEFADIPPPEPLIREATTLNLKVTAKPVGFTVFAAPA